MLKQRLEEDLKAALRSRDVLRTSVLRSLKSAITYAEVAQKAKQTGLDNTAIEEVFRKEAKKRQDSADMYEKADRIDQAKQELAEKDIINQYLPQALSVEEVKEIIDQVSGEIGLTQQTMGQVIAAVKTKSEGRAEGGLIAKLVKEKL